LGRSPRTTASGSAESPRTCAMGRAGVPLDR
jgi:hypothetical protein